MALKNRIGKFTFKYDGDEITLQSNLANLESLYQDTGVDFYEFIDKCTAPKNLAKLFFHLQVDSDYSEQDIYGAFFGNIMAFQEPEYQAQLQEMTFSIMGMDKRALIRDDQASKKKDGQAS